VPTYESECAACRRVFEIRQRISEPPLTTCDACGGAVHRLLSAAPFILKGEGWYVTDYPSEARKKAKEAEKSTSKSPSNGASDKAEKPAADKPAADKPASDKPAATSPSTSTTGAASPSAPAKSD